MTRILRFRLIGALAGVGLLAACMTPEPVTQGPKGRALVSGAEAAALFRTYCYNTPNGSAARKSGAFTLGDASLPNTLTGEHKTKAIDLTSVTLSKSSSCMLSFVGTKPAVESASEAAAVLQATLKVSNVGGRKGGGQVNLVTPKGSVVVGNGSKRHRHGFSILLLATK